jgi:Secretion system C-terminal sorting domain
LNLQQGENIELYFGDIEFLQPWDGPPTELCFWLSKPNNKLDDNIYNKRLCIDLPPLITNTQVVLADHFSFFPNPASNTLNVRFDPTNPIINSISIVDMAGRVLQSQKLSGSHQTISLNVSDLLPGTYVLLLRDNNSVTRQLFVKS